jgi:hypothetical protein
LLLLANAREMASQSGIGCFKKVVTTPDTALLHAQEQP